jgi:menaquinone-dependent protoporphyrinogen oxidase
MNKKILLIYASVDGQTKKISNYLSGKLNNSDITVIDIEEFDKSPEDYDVIVLGSSIRYGVHQKSMIEFIQKHQSTLDSKKTAFFSVNLVARKPEKNQPDTNPYVIKFFKSISWRPTMTEVFAGKLDYKKYPFFDRIMIQFIMWMTKGPTDSNTKIEYTDWKRVEDFGKRILTL